MLADGLVLQWVIYTEARPYRLVSFDCTVIRDRGVYLTTRSGEGWDGAASPEFTADIVVVPTATGLTCRARVNHPEGVRVLKTVIHGLPPGLLRTTAGDGHRSIGARHRSTEYPGPWPTPVVWLEPDVVGRRFVARTACSTVARKAFSARLRPSGDTELMLYEEAHAPSYGPEFSGATWNLSFVPSVMGELAAHGDELGQLWHLKPMEEREDASPWLRRCDLVVRLSGMDFNGRVHLDFDGMAEVAALLGRYGDLSHTLFHVSGWDGAYMRECPCLRPAPQLGGSEGLRRLVSAIHASGAKVILGTNPACASEELALREGLTRYQSQGFMGGAIDYPARDWDGDGFSETGWLLLNLSFAEYRDRLTARCEELIDTLGVDGFYLGGTDLYASDRRGDPFEGWRALVRELRELRRDLVLVGEGHADYIACLTPVFEPHSRVDSAEFQLTVGKWGRSVAYSAVADAQHRAGVGEHVHAQYRPLKGVSRSVLPAVTVARKTLETNLEYVMTGLQWARTWQALYGSRPPNLDVEAQRLL